MKYIIYNLWILMFLFACSESEQGEYSKLWAKIPAYLRFP